MITALVRRVNHLASAQGGSGKAGGYFGGEAGVDADRAGELGAEVGRNHLDT
jgi:hypothetical protein